jgi:hypothetical protein
MHQAFTYGTYATTDTCHLPQDYTDSEPVSVQSTLTREAPGQETETMC